MAARWKIKLEYSRVKSGTRKELMVIKASDDGTIHQCTDIGSGKKFPDLRHISHVERMLPAD